MKQFRTSGYAFTLIELLVVIAIISILAAILFPVFASAREKARQITCASNEKQILQALNMYAGDFDEGLPQANYSHNGNVGWLTTLESGYGLTPYSSVNSAGQTVYHANGIHACPDFRSNYPASLLTGGNTQDTQQIGNSYIVNEFLVPANASLGTSIPPATVGSILNPSNQVLLAEGEGIRYFTEGNDTGVNDDETPGSGTPGDGSGPDSVSQSKIAQIYDSNVCYVWARIRHSGGSNYGFPDGHVKWFRAPSPNGTTGARSVGGDASEAKLELPITPIESQANVVYSHEQFPTASAWFIDGQYVNTVPATGRPSQYNVPQN